VRDQAIENFYKTSEILFWSGLGDSHSIDNQGYTAAAAAATTILWPFVQDHPGEPVSEETFTQSHLS